MRRGGRNFHRLSVTEQLGEELPYVRSFFAKMYRGMGPKLDK